MDRLKEDVLESIRIGLRHARMMVEKIPLTKQDGSKRTIEEYQQILIHAIRELEREELL